MDQASVEAARGVAVVHVRLEIPIRAPRAHVWELLVNDVAAWWPRDFHAASAPSSMRLDAALGGRLIEQSEDGGGVLWYTVVALRPGHVLDLAGTLSAAFGGPSQTMLHIELHDDGAHTRMVVADAVLGLVSENTQASLIDGWRAVFDHGFRAYVERLTP